MVHPRRHTAPAVRPNCTLVMSKWSRGRVRLVLMVGAMTTLATSPLEDWERRAELEVESIESGQSVHFTARFSEVAHRQAHGLSVAVRPDVSDQSIAVARVRIVPDDPGIPPQELLQVQRRICAECDGGVSEPTYDPDASVPPPEYVGYFLIPRELCPETGECVHGFTVELLAVEKGLAMDSVGLRVYAVAGRERDSSFICAKDVSDFDEGAEVTVTLDE
jgi:hypothetical protein